MAYSVKDNMLYKDGERVAYKASPNVGKDFKPLYIVLHFTATAGLSSPLNWLTNKVAKVSSQLVLARDGKVWQLAPLNKVCWHAGKSEWKGLSGLNSYSIGIEQVNAGQLSKKDGKYYSVDKVLIPDCAVKIVDGKAWHTYTAEQIAECKLICEALAAHYKIKEVVGHEEIAPKRKTDPGPVFPMELFRIT